MRTIGQRGPLNWLLSNSTLPRCKQRPPTIQHRLLASRGRSAPKTLKYRPRSQVDLPSSTPKNPGEPSPQAPKSILSARRIPLYGVILTGALFTVYLTLLYRSISRDIAAYADKDIPEDVSDRYNSTAEHFDSDVSTLEWVLGIDKLRKQLCSKATGHVLEVSVGTGRNMVYLPLERRGEGKIKTVTMVDKNREMLYQARHKWGDPLTVWFIWAQFYLRDAREPIPFPDGEGGYDTVLQTMGVCSCGEPEEVLRNLGRMTKKDTGRILLLEHGRSWYDLVNRWWIDRVAKAHADRYGCWFNRDVEEIVEKSGLEVVEKKRFHLGTTYWFVLKPSQKIIEERQREQIKMKEAEEEEKRGEAASEGKSWYFWWSK